jgi:hypothetical protein
VSTTVQADHGGAAARLDAGRLAGAASAVLWLLWCVRWFDPGAPWRFRALAALPQFALALPAVVLLVLWLRARGPALRGEPLEPPARTGLLLLVALTVFSRLPIALGGAASAITPDGTVYGIVTLRILDGSQRLVFLPNQAYGGTLTAHLVAPFVAVADISRVFALASLLFYALYVAGLHRLAHRLFGARVALVAGLYAAFAPVAVTRCSLNNDGTYVELLALGTWALWLLARWTQEASRRPLLALAIGLLLGLCFWYHIFAMIHVAAAVLVMLAFGPRGAPRSLASLALGGVLGSAPALLWNAVNEWQSLEYFVPGLTHGGAAGSGMPVVGFGARLLAMVTENAPVLMGYDVGYGPALDRLLLALGWLGVVVALVSVLVVARLALSRRSWPLGAVLVFLAVNVVVVGVAARHVSGNPRYLLTVMSVLPALMAFAFGVGRRRLLLFALIAGSALAAAAQVPETIRGDGRWREFVARLEAEGVRYCYTDFYLATRIGFLSRERVLCSSKLGPTTTEFFFDVRRRVEVAPEAAFVAVNRTAAARLSRRLDELGVRHERLELMKPVLLRLERKVDPQELFPWREFPLR